MLMDDAEKAARRLRDDAVWLRLQIKGVQGIRLMAVRAGRSAGNLDIRGARILVAVAMLVGIGLRFWHLAASPLWLDEAYSAFAADHGFGFLWRVVPRYETHPPFYYTLLHLWDMGLGRTLLSRRLLGVLCGMVTLAMVGLCGLSLGRLTGLGSRGRGWLVSLTLLLVACQPLMVDMSRQVRPYPVMGLAYAVAIYGLLRLAEDGLAGHRPGRRWIALVFAGEALVLWLHSLAPLFGLSISLALAIVLRWRGLGGRDRAWLLGGQTLAALAYLPAMLIMLSQASTWVKATWLAFDPAMLPEELSYLYLDWNPWSCLVGAMIALAGAVALVRRREGARVLAALLVLALLPPLLSILLSMAVAPVFLVRTLSAATVPGLLAIGYGLAWIATRESAWRWLLWPVAALLLVPMVATDLDHDSLPQQDWYGLIAWLAPRMAPGDVVWAYPNEGALPLAYALADEGQSLPFLSVPKPVPAFGVPGYFPTGSRGVVSLYPAQIDALMATPYARSPPTIWLLRLAPERYDPQDEMPRALERERSVVARYKDGIIDLIALRRRGLEGRASSWPDLPKGALAHPSAGRGQP